MGCSGSHSVQEYSNTMSPNPNLPHFKIIIVGDPGVGKTAIFLRYLSDKFDARYTPTQTSNSATVERAISNNKSSIFVTLTLIDIPADASVETRSEAMSDIDAAIVVVDLTDADSINLCGTWKRDVLCIATKSKKSLRSGVEKTSQFDSTELTGIESKSFPILLVGTKVDCIPVEDKLLPGENEKVKYTQSTDELEKVSDKHAFHKCVKVSSKNKDGGVREVFASLLQHLVQLKAVAYMSGNQRLQQYNPAQQTLLHQNSQPTQGHHTAPHPKINTIHLAPVVKRKNVKVSLELLECVGVPQIDSICSTCNALLNELAQLNSEFLNSIQYFVETCVEERLVTSPNSDLEECLVEFRLRLESICQLEIIKDGDFVQIVVKEDENRVPKNDLALVRRFQEKVISSCHKILSRVPTILDTLMKASSQLTFKSRQAWDLAVLYGKTMEDVKVALSKVNANERCLKAGEIMAQTTLRKVDETRLIITKAICMTE